MSIDIKVVSNDCKVTSDEMMKQLQTLIKLTAHNIEAGISATIVAKDIIDTGNLLNSVGPAKQTDEAEWEVTVHADYAAYVEYGTTSMGDRPYVRPVVDDVQPKFHSGAKRIVGN